MPGQDISRVVLVGHRGHLYELTFPPADRGNESYTHLEARFSSVTGSWHFLNN
jgi:hypothetical protein